MSRREFPKKVKAEAFLRCHGQCEGEGCGAWLTVGKFHFDHDIPDGLGGEPILDNCKVLCMACHKVKTTTRDVPLIAKAKRIREKHLGIRTPRQKIQSRGFSRSEPQRTASRPVNR